MACHYILLSRKEKEFVASQYLNLHLCVYTKPNKSNIYKSRSWTFPFWSHAANPKYFDSVCHKSKKYPDFHVLIMGVILSRVEISLLEKMRVQSELQCMISLLVSNCGKVCQKGYCDAWSGIVIVKYHHFAFYITCKILSTLNDDHRHAQTHAVHQTMSWCGLWHFSNTFSPNQEVRMTITRKGNPVCGCYAQCWTRD